MSGSTSRRSLVMSATALPILAVPAIAIAGPAPAIPQTDPIFAAIQACIEAERADAVALDRLNEAEERFEDEHGSPEPDAISKDIRQMWRKHEGLEKLAEGQCRSHEVVDRFWDIFGARGRTAKDFDEEEWADSRAYLHEELDRQTAAYNKTVVPMKEAADAASQRFSEAAETLMETEPTTFAGLAALFATLNENVSLRHYLFADYDIADTIVRTLATATANFVAVA
jgi:hypothetical protein